jgi:flagellar motor switch protein FliM
LKEILSIKPGDLIILDKKINSNVDVKVDNEKWFEGKWGTRKNKGAIKINKTIY